MGWLGWTEREAADTDVNSILIAMEGRLEMMYPKKPNRPTVAQRFRDFAKSHNERVKNGRSSR